MVRELHHFSSKFVISLRAKLVEELRDDVPDSMSFKVGYYEGQKHTKMWIVTNDDLQAMYRKFASGEIILWCEGREEDGRRGTGKRKRDDLVASKHQEREEDVDNIFSDLKDKHNDRYETPKLRLWARMIASKIHESYEQPPNIPAFKIFKKPRKESVSDAIEGAAQIFAKAVSGTNNIDTTQSAPKSSVVSPEKVVELRMKNYEQLRYIQELFKDGILDIKEYDEQKENILSAIRKL